MKLRHDVCKLTGCPTPRHLINPRYILCAVISCAVIVHLACRSIGVTALSKHQALLRSSNLDSSATLAIQASVQYWNAQPDPAKYQVADRQAPLSKSCSCYAQWLNRTVEDVCDVVREVAGTQIYPRPLCPATRSWLVRVAANHMTAQSNKSAVHLAIPTGWLDERRLCTTNAQPTGTFDCPASLCHYSVISANDGPAPDYSTFDGVLHYSGEGMPPIPEKPKSVPWFRRGFIWEEPDYE